MSAETLAALEQQLATLASLDDDDPNLAAHLNEALSFVGAKVRPFSAAKARASPERPRAINTATAVPTLLELCIRSIGTNLHLYACLRGLPRYISDRILELFKDVYGRSNSAVIDDLKVDNFLDLRLEELAERGLPLTVLNLQWSARLSDAGAAVVASKCPGLRELDLSHCEAIGDDGVRALARGCGELVSLNLTRCARLTDAGLEALARGCKGLASVNLEMCTGVTDAGVQALARGAKRLCDLNVGGCGGVTNVGVQIVAAHGASLLRLNLGGCQLTDYDVEDVAKRCLALQDLVLRACGMLTDGAAHHVGLLCRRQARDRPGEQGLSLLDLGGCRRITGAGLGRLAPYATWLRVLDLRGLELVGEELLAVLPRMPALRDATVSGAVDPPVLEMLEKAAPELKLEVLARRRDSGDAAAAVGGDVVGAAAAGGGDAAAGAAAAGAGVAAARALAGGGGRGRRGGRGRGRGGRGGRGRGGRAGGGLLRPGPAPPRPPRRRGST